MFYTKPRGTKGANNTCAPRKRTTPTKAERRLARRLKAANENVVSEFGDGKRMWKKTELGKIICHTRPGSLNAR